MKAISVIIASVFLSAACHTAPVKNLTPTNMTTDNKNLDTATFGQGCFWCAEAIFQQLKGIESITSGFSGGHIKNPSYREVCMGTTGHAEVIQVVYDTTQVSYTDLLYAFFDSHDPTSLNKQGADEGTQYRSVIFYHNAKQKEEAENIKAALDKAGLYKKPIVTEISPFTAFYKAEDYHQDYYNENGSAPYCTYVIKPKLEKFREVFQKTGKLKNGN